MNTTKNFHEIVHKLTETKFYKLENIDIGKAFTITILNFENEKIIYNLRGLIKNLLFISYKYTHQKNVKSKILMFYSHQYSLRKDHLNSFKNLVKILQKSSSLVGINKYRLNFSNIMLFVYSVIWFYQLKRFNFSISFNLYVLSYLLETYKWNKFLIKSKFNQKYDLLISFFDAGFYDNIFTQLFNRSNKKTATLQHGHFLASKPYFITKQDIGIAFEGFISDYFLIWGELTKIEAKKHNIPDNKLLIVGPANYIGKFQEYEYKRIKRKVFGIVLDGNKSISLEHNRKLIRFGNFLAKKYKMKYIIKAHPVSNIKDFLEVIDKKQCLKITNQMEVREFASNIDFSLVSGSSVYIELLYLKVIVFRLSDEYDRYSSINQFIFSDNYQLKELVEEFFLNFDYVISVQSEIRKAVISSGDIKLNYINAINYILEEYHGK